MPDAVLSVIAAGWHNGESILVSRMWLLHRNTPCAEYPLLICALGNLSSISAPGALATGSVRETYGAVIFVLLRITQVKTLLESHRLGGRIAAGCPSGNRGSGPDRGATVSRATLAS